MHIRTMREDDQDDLLRLWNDSAHYDPLTAALLQEKIHGDEEVDSNLCLVAEIGNNIAGFGVGVVRHSSAARKGFIKLLAVDPAQQRQGVGRALLERLETVISSRGATTIRWLESAPNHLAPGIDIRYHSGIGFAERCGYEKVGEAFNLTVDLQEKNFIPPAVAVSSDVTLRRATLEDAGSVSAFLRERWPTWDAEVAVALRNVPPTLHLALRDDRVAGFAAHDANNLGTGWFGPMGVAASERHSGIGCALLKLCLSDIQAQGHGVAIIPWVDAIPFYKKCAGAVLSRTFARYEKTVTK